MSTRRQPGPPPKAFTIEELAIISIAREHFWFFPRAHLYQVFRGTDVHAR